MEPMALKSIISFLINKLEFGHNMKDGFPNHYSSNK